MRRLLVVLLAFLAVPALPAGALPDPGFHAPIRVLGDEMFPLVDGISGEGTAARPYVIAGARFEQVARPGTAAVSGVNTDVVESSILIQDTTAHVIIRFNRFTAIDPDPPATAPVSGDARTAIRIVRAENVRIEQNSFEDVGTYRAPSISFSLASGLSIVKNRFDGPQPFGGDTSSVTITDNKVTAPFGVDVSLRDVTGVIARNTLPMGLYLNNPTTMGNLVVDHNQFNGGVDIAAGLSTVDLWANSVSSSADLAGTGLSVRGNAFTMWADQLWVDDFDVPTLDATNTMNGRKILIIGPIDGATLVAPGDVGWLSIRGATNLVIKNLDLDEDGYFSMSNSENVRFEDTTFGGYVDVYGSGVLSFERVTFANGAFVAEEFCCDDTVTLRFIDVVSLNGLLVSNGGELVEMLRGEYHADEDGFVLDVWHGACGGTQSTLKDMKILGADAYVFLGSFCGDDYGFRVEGVSFPADGDLDMGFGRADARGNWWGSVDGPTVDEDEPHGATIWASDPADVLFDPWLTSPP